MPRDFTLAAAPEAAIAICDRHTGVGADGWILIEESSDAHAGIKLWNSDGSRSEISGNGTRCAAALLLESGEAQSEVLLHTGAGMKHLSLLARSGMHFSIEMNMGPARVEELESSIVPGRSAVILNVGNPQCAVFVDDFEFNWRTLGAELERHPHFPNRTNVSFVRVMDRNNLDVRFFERGAGETMSSGTGSTGAAAAAVARGFAEPPVTVHTPAGALPLRWEGDDILLAGPAEIVVRGEYFWQK